MLLYHTVYIIPFSKFVMKKIQFSFKKHTAYLFVIICSTLCVDELIRSANEEFLE